jgi:DNA adenine methylase
MQETTIPTLHSIIKWTGGKNRLVDTISPYIPDDYHRYLEPFIGGASMLLHLHPEHAIINDINAELINLYKVVQDDCEAMIREAASMKNDKEQYYKIRDLDREPGYQQLPAPFRAARFMYLNHTGFNGLYRTNRKGQMNVSYAYYKNPNICNESLVRNMSAYLHDHDVTIMNTDYKDVLHMAHEDDIIYIDPPYASASDDESFLRYDKNIFDIDSQHELLDECNALTQRGVRFIQSNSDTDTINDMYHDYRIEHITTNRTISNTTRAKQAKEVLIMNY